MGGKKSMQNNPRLFTLQPFLRILLSLVNDNSADAGDSFPNDFENWMTYEQALEQDLDRDPFIPSTSTFLSQA